jgi:hypothetical protein
MLAKNLFIEPLAGRRCCPVISILVEEPNFKKKKANSLK